MDLEKEPFLEEVWTVKTVDQVVVFSNAKFKKHYNIINLSDVEFAITKWAKEITKETLLDTGVITRKSLGVKLLGNWELTSKISITVDVASAWAKAAVEKAGGTLNVSVS